MSADEGPGAAPMPTAPDQVVVVGTGAAALAAAVAAHDRGAAVVVVERTSTVGGTTAVSGGGVWMPQNDHMAEVGTRTRGPRPWPTWAG